MNKYAIVNKYNMYYSNTISKDLYHFCGSLKEAHIFNTKGEANQKLKKFKKQENYKVVKI